MTDFSGSNAAEIYCYMREMGNDYQPSFEAAYAFIRSRKGGMFEISPERAAVMITEAVVSEPGRFPPNSDQYIDDLFGVSKRYAVLVNEQQKSNNTINSNSFGNETDIVSPDFNAPVDALPSPEFRTFNSLTNPAPGVGGDDSQPDHFAHQSRQDFQDLNHQEEIEMALKQLESLIRELERESSREEFNSNAFVNEPDVELANAPVDALPSPVFRTFDSLTNPAPGVSGDDSQPDHFAHQSRQDIQDSARLTAEALADLEIQQMIEMLIKELELAEREYDREARREEFNSNAFGNEPDVEFTDDPLTNFQANANEFTGGNAFDMVGHANGGWMTAEPITEIMEFPLGQDITFEESGMDGLVAAGSFDTAALNETQNNNVF